MLICIAANKEGKEKVSKQRKKYYYMFQASAPPTVNKKELNNRILID
jgi:hypothetical protein